jgi:hypothetical protein
MLHAGRPEVESGITIREKDYQGNSRKDENYLDYDDVTQPRKQRWTELTKKP